MHDYARILFLFHINKRALFVSFLSPTLAVHSPLTILYDSPPPIILIHSIIIHSPLTIVLLQTPHSPLTIVLLALKYEMAVHEYEYEMVVHERTYSSTSIGTLPFSAIGPPSCGYTPHTNTHTIILSLSLSSIGTQVQDGPWCTIEYVMSHYL